jgi:hypothetical protein
MFPNPTPEQLENMKVIDTKAIKEKYQPQYTCEAYGSSTIKIGTYLEVAGETDQEIQSQLDSILGGTFGGQFAKFGNGRFRYIAWSE